MLTRSNRLLPTVRKWEAIASYASFEAMTIGKTIGIQPIVTMAGPATLKNRKRGTPRAPSPRRIVSRGPEGMNEETNFWQYGGRTQCLPGGQIALASHVQKVYTVGGGKNRVFRAIMSLARPLKL
jgi:hypothetical protein